MNYQSFADQPGGSASEKKLLNLKLPNMRGLRFLDLGCNEGFFCLHAKQNGAARVIGIDANERILSLARERAKAMGQDIDYFKSDFLSAPEGPHDVILLSSALHYAANPIAVLDRISELLSPNGTFVLECGVVFAPGATVTRALRGPDERFFPTYDLLTKTWLRRFSFRYIGRSVDQPGDPIQRHVFHCKALKPTVILITGESGRGKSSLARGISDGAVVISTDKVFAPARVNTHKTSPYQKLYDDAVAATGGIGQGWLQVRENAELIKFFVETLSQAIMLNKDAGTIVVEGFILSDLIEPLKKRLGNGYYYWTASP